MKWNPNLPLLTLPKEIRKIFLEEAEFIYNDLKANKLEVVLVEAPYPYEDRNKIRVADSWPPEWYSRLYNTLGRNRKRVLESLSRIANLKDGEFKKHNYKLDTILRDFIFERLSVGYEHNGCYTKSNKKIRKYFDVK